MVAAVAAADLRPKEIQAKWDQEKRNANILIGSEKNRETIGAIFYLIIGFELIKPPKKW